MAGPARAAAPMAGPPGGPGAGPRAGLPMARAVAIQPTGDIPYRKLIRWGWFTVSVARGWFLINTLLTITLDLLTQYNVQVLAVVVSGLTGNPRANGQGFLSAILPQDVRTAAVVFASLAIGLLLARMLERVMTAWTDTLMLTRLQQVLHDRLLRLGADYHGRHDVSETTLILTRFAPGAQLFLRSLISFPVVQGIGLISAVVFLLNNLQSVGNTPAWIQLSLLLVLVLLPIGGYRLAQNVRAAFTALRESELVLVNEFTNSASLPLEVQMMGAEEQRAQAFASKLSGFRKAKVAATVRNEMASQFQQITPVALQTIFLLYGVFVALQSGNPGAAGAILGIFYFVPMAVSPIQQIIQFFNGLNSAWPQVEQVVEVLEKTPQDADQSGSRDLTQGAKEVVLEDVVFTYAKGGARILDGITHTFPAGQVSAIVGRAGSGKSSILNLVSRIRTPDQGGLKLGETPIREVRRSSLRQNVAKVSQFPLFLNDTIRANFKLMKASATDAEIEAVCRKTGLWEVLQRAANSDHPLDYVLPRNVAEGLSGGQRRLLAVTRALLLQPAILMLDEPTTGIDAIGRADLAQVLKGACAECTVLLVDHSMEFISRVADHVCCLENGKFADVGTPEELSRRPNLFQSLLEASEEEEHR